MFWLGSIGKSLDVDRDLWSRSSDLLGMRQASSTSHSQESSDRFDVIQTLGAWWVIAVRCCWLEMEALLVKCWSKTSLNRPTFDEVRKRSTCSECSFCNFRNNMGMSEFFRLWQHWRESWALDSATTPTAQLQQPLLQAEDLAHSLCQMLIMHRKLRVPNWIFRSLL